jgi:2-keto-4-pentenoate hydratase
MACASWAAIGPAVSVDWCARDLGSHDVEAFRNGQSAAAGCGANVGGPLHALTWLANELRAHATGLRRGDVIITGTCVPPVAIVPGDRVRMDFGDLGLIELAFNDN